MAYLRVKVGSYTEEPGTATCSLANAGNYVPDDDRTKEIQCDEGYYSPGPGASACFACSAGRFSEASGRVLRGVF